MADGLELGSRFEIERLSGEPSKQDTTIVAFIPSLSYDCEYASMLTQSFHYYFIERLAFEGLAKSPTTRVILVVNDDKDDAKSTQNILDGMDVIYDPKGEMYSYFGVKKPSERNSATTLVLLDSKNVVQMIDDDYKSQGEHLKPLESKLKELNNIKPTIAAITSPKRLKVGMAAPDFRIDSDTLLSDLRGKVVLVSFYPAAFSGTLRPPIELSSLGEITFSADRMSCSFQIDLIDESAKPKSETRRILISSSTDSLLNRWQGLLGTENVQYANDPDYSISQTYLSYNPKGYNNRVSVIVDQKGKIAFIDQSFDYEDDAVISKKIDELAEKGSR